MARTELTVQNIVRAGVSASYTAAIADNHKFTNNGRMFAHVKNGSGGAIVVTIQTPGTVDGLAIADRTVSIPATTGDVMIGPFPPGQYNQSDGMVYIDYASTTSMTIGVFQLGP